MPSAAPAPFHVYRGQSRKGIGEGAGRLIAHGEQYLAASEELDQDAELLDAFRLWISLDSDPADHQRLGDQLEGWSFLQHRGFQLVARLVSAGSYDRRVAYFAHGRVWALGAPVPGFDPALYLGRSEAFEPPWRDEDRVLSAPHPESLPVLVRPEQVASEREMATLLAAHLLQCCVRRTALVLAVPIAEFVPGAALHALVSFAHGALPRTSRRSAGCVYSRTPSFSCAMTPAWSRFRRT